MRIFYALLSFVLTVSFLLFSQQAYADTYEEVTTTTHSTMENPSFFDYERSGTKPSVAWRKYYNHYTFQDVMPSGEALNDSEIEEGTPVASQTITVAPVANGKPSISEPESFYDQARVRQTLVHTKNGQRLVTEKTVLKDPFPELYPPVIERTRVVTAVSNPEKTQTETTTTTQTAPDPSAE